MKKDRLVQWMSGEIDDDDLTQEEVKDLQDRVNHAVMQKILERHGVHSFPEHDTLQ